MSHHISISWDALQEQILNVVVDYKNNAISNTEQLPKGVDRTAVVVAMIAASAVEYRTAAMVVASQNIAKVIKDAADATNITNTDALFHISNSLDTIAEAISK